MRFDKTIVAVLIFIFAFTNINLSAKTGRYRLVWKDDPSISITIGWDQISGSDGKVFFDVTNHGKFPSKYSFSKNPDNVVSYKGMKNTFVRLFGLQPNTIYYFVVADSDG